jgi:hypothetical protein
MPNVRLARVRASSQVLPVSQCGQYIPGVMHRGLTKRIGSRLGLALVVLAAIWLACCTSNYVTPYEFEGYWSGPASQQWQFNSDGGSYSSLAGVYDFDFTYASVDEGNQHILINITSVTGLFPPAYIKAGAQVYVMYSISGDSMWITFDQNSYVTPGGLDGPFTRQ